MQSLYFSLHFPIPAFESKDERPYRLIWRDEDSLDGTQESDSSNNGEDEDSEIADESSTDGPERHTQDKQRRKTIRQSHTLPKALLIHRRKSIQRKLRTVGHELQKPSKSPWRNSLPGDTSLSIADRLLHLQDFKKYRNQLEELKEKKKSPPEPSTEPIFSESLAEILRATRKTKKLQVRRLLKIQEKLHKVEQNLVYEDCTTKRNINQQTRHIQYLERMKLANNRSKDRLDAEIKHYTSELEKAQKLHESLSPNTLQELRNSSLAHIEKLASKLKAARGEWDRVFQLDAYFDQRVSDVKTQQCEDKMKTDVLHQHLNQCRKRLHECDDQLEVLNLRDVPCLQSSVFSEMEDTLEETKKYLTTRDLPKHSAERESLLPNIKKQPGEIVPILKRRKDTWTPWYLKIIENMRE